jgi:hypothetical protein
MAAAGETMKLPAELKHTMHKAGGRVERVTRIGHTVARPRDGRSQDVWYFVGDVTWRDGSASKGTEIAPYALCADEGDREPELHGLFDLLTRYLLIHGSWCVGASGHEGWYAHSRKGGGKK